MAPGVVFTNLVFSCKVLFSTYGIHFFDINNFVVEVDMQQAWPFLKPTNCTGVWP
jgi:hypothetical protein